jgi:hypothetical protein
LGRETTGLAIIFGSYPVELQRESRKRIDLLIPLARCGSKRKNVLYHRGSMGGSLHDALRAVLEETNPIRQLLSRSVDAGVSTL